MRTNGILIAIQIAWAWLWSFVKSGCKSIWDYDKIWHKKIDRKKNRDSKRIKEAKKTAISVLIGICLLVFPIGTFGLVLGALYAVALALWTFTNWLMISLLPAELLFAANIATWIAYLFLPFIFVLHLVWRFFKGAPAGLEDD
jgi:hypothetical protein